MSATAGMAQSPPDGLDGSAQSPSDHLTRLLQEQKELEGECMALGAERFRQSLQHAEANHEATRTGGYRQLLSKGLPLVKAGLDEMLEASKHRGGPKHVAVRWVVAVGTETAAYMALKVALDSIAIRTTTHRAARNVSGLILDELRYRRFQEQAPALFRYRMDSFTTSHYGHMKRSLDATLLYAQVPVADLDISDSHRLLVGLKLLDVVAQTTKLLVVERGQVEMQRSRRQAQYRSTSYLTATEDTKAWLAERNAVLAETSCVNYPMVVPPLPWAPNHRGGYRYMLRNEYALVRAWRPTAETTAAEKREMPLVYATLNALQDTAWKINPDVLALTREIISSGAALAGLASVENQPLPPKPQGFMEDKAVRRAWRKQATAVREHNRMRGVRIIEQTNTLRVAERLASHAAIYFPYNLDFRGRIYSIPSFLSPQGDDLSKALLTFAEGKPLGESGAVWLAIHGMNCLGETPEGQKVSRMTFEERVSYVLRHTAEIAQVAADPIRYSWWADAEEPLQFFAFCAEWTRAHQQYSRSGQWDYISALPCGMDGSCNGLQHFSAMFRDPIGGRAVNLTDNASPEDVYEEVAGAVNVALQSCLVSDNPVEADLAGRWLRSGLVNRKLCKRPTMTFGYGSKQYGFREQLIHELTHRPEYLTEVKPLFTQTTEEGKEKVVLPLACALLSRCIWEALQNTVVAAYDGMAWLQACARSIASEERAVRWTVPVTGFPVYQAYFKEQKTHVKTLLAGSIVQPAVYTATPEVLTHKQANSVAPNVVHSLDAAALMLTVTRSAAAGIESFGMIHDSFSTVPADCEQLARITREAFVALYMEQDVAAHLAEQFASQTTEPLPPPPAKGSLDLSEVLRSKYFFA